MRLFSLLLLLAVSPAALAQTPATGSLTGTVTYDGDGLPGASVLLLDLQRGVATNIDGLYTLAGLPAGTHTVRVSFAGMETHETEVTVYAGQTTRMDTSLRVDPRVMDVGPCYVVRPMISRDPYSGVSLYRDSVDESALEAFLFRAR